MWASSRAAALPAVRPLCRAARPLRLPVRKRALQRCTLVVLQPSAAAAPRTPFPPATNKMTRARRTSSARKVRERTRRCSSRRSVGARIKRLAGTHSYQDVMWSISMLRCTGFNHGGSFCCWFPGFDSLSEQQRIAFIGLAGAVSHAASRSLSADNFGSSTSMPSPGPSGTRAWSACTGSGVFNTLAARY